VDATPSRPTGVDYAALFAGIPTSYLVMSPVAPDYLILDANDAYLANVDRTREQIIGVPVFEAFPPSPDTFDEHGVPWIRRSFDRAVATGQPDTMPLQKYDVPDPSGAGMVERYWSLISVPILDAGGEVVLLVQRAENITEFMQQQGQGPAELERSELWRRRAQEVETDLYARARELAVAVQAQQVASRRLSSLADVTMQLASADSVVQLADIIFRAGLPLLGASGGSVAVRQPDSDTLRVTITPSLGGAMQRTYAEVPLEGPLPTSIAARLGQVVLVPDERAAGGYEGLAEGMAMSATRAWAVLPLRVGTRLLGSIGVGFAEPQEFPADEVELLRALASQCAQVLDRLQVRDRERLAAEEVARIAETLQRSLLTDPPDSDDLLFAVTYQPAQQVAQVGGDWYDAFVTGSGATTLVIGDVAGHDQDAAATMAQVRNVLRGIAQVLERAPSVVLGALDRALDLLDVPVTASIVLAQIGPPVPGHSSRVLRWCNAGHPPPVLLRAGGGAEVLSREPDLLAGVGVTHARTDHEVTLDPGDIVLMYTDGLVETRGGDIDRDIERLRDRVASGAVEAGPKALLQLLLTDEPSFDDDVALLAVQIQPG
jgi:serine phosphatase RsbU (regulator of sigma subunit)